MLFQLKRIDYEEVSQSVSSTEYGPGPEVLVWEKSLDSRAHAIRIAVNQMKRSLESFEEIRPEFHLYGKQDTGWVEIPLPTVTLASVSSALFGIFQSRTYRITPPQ